MSNYIYLGKDAAGLADTKINGSCKHSGHGEYDNLTGYVTRRYQTEWQDASGTWWRKTCTVVNLGRPDRGTVGDVDALIADEPWGYDETSRVSGIKRAAAARDQETIDTIQAHLLRVGTAWVGELAEVAGVSRATIHRHLTRHSEIYYRLPGNGGMWGLVAGHAQEAA